MKSEFIQRTGNHTFLIHGDAYIIAKEIEMLFKVAPAGSSVNCIPTRYLNGLIQESVVIVSTIISLDAIPVSV